MPISLSVNRKISDKAGIVYEIGDCLYTLPNLVKIHSIKNNKDIIFVEAPDIFSGRYEIRKMSKKTSHRAIFDQMLWPDRLSQDYSGFITRNPHMEGDLCPLSEVIEKRKAENEFSCENMNYYLELGIQLAEIIQTVHDCGYLIGRLLPDSFWVSKEGRLYACTSYRFAFSHLDTSDNPYYVAPEWLIHAAGERIEYNQSSDSFIYALILFQLLTGKYPFVPNRDGEKMEREELWELMCDGKSLYFWEDSEIIQSVSKILKKAAPKSEALFKRTFDYCGYEDYGEFRPSIKEWLECLDRYSGA